MLQTWFSETSEGNTHSVCQNAAKKDEEIESHVSQYSGLNDQDIKQKLGGKCARNRKMELLSGLGVTRPGDVELQVKETVLEEEIRIEFKEEERVN